MDEERTRCFICLKAYKINVSGWFLVPLTVFTVPICLECSDRIFPRPETRQVSNA